jgi:hypothetical protein
VVRGGHSAHWSEPEQQTNKQTVNKSKKKRNDFMIMDVARIFTPGSSNHNRLAGQELQIFKKSKLFVDLSLFDSIPQNLFSA